MRTLTVQQLKATERAKFETLNTDCETTHMMQLLLGYGGQQEVASTLRLPCKLQAHE